MTTYSCAGKVKPTQHSNIEQEFRRHQQYNSVFQAGSLNQLELGTGDPEGGPIYPATEHFLID